MHLLVDPVSYTHLRAHETVLDLVCRLLLEKKTITAIHNDIDLLIKESITKTSQTLSIHHSYSNMLLSE